ncbi:hypothetical protein HZB74_04085 [Candidatus Saccharibacteria bacterium]|nr:hypothetical protein [Candidatus Saccharibacteria bacterium]
MDENKANIPPQNLEAEASLLGSILIDADAIVKVADIVDESDFYDRKHQDIYAAIKKLYSGRSPIDVLTLSEQLSNDGTLDRAGGSGYLSELTNFVPSATHAVQYAKIVAAKAVRRRLIKASQDVIELGYKGDDDVQELIEMAETKLFEVSKEHVKEDIVSLENILSDNFERLDELHKDKATIRGVPTGFKDLDNILAGLQKSDLFILDFDHYYRLYIHRLSAACIHSILILSQAARGKIRIPEGIDYYVGL